MPNLLGASLVCHDEGGCLYVAQSVNRSGTKLLRLRGVDGRPQRVGGDTREK